jgi:hypothetical protein
LEAILELTETVGEVQGNPCPAVMWAWVMRRPRIKRAVRIKEAYIMKELTSAVRRLTGLDGQGHAVRSAVNHMVVSETKLAEKDGRAPDYFSRVMIDEVNNDAPPSLSMSLLTATFPVSFPATRSS